MFEGFRETLNDLMDRGTPPDVRRAGLAEMKQTLVQARMGLDDLRGGVATTKQRLDVELRELETMRRRKAAATAINDAETVALAEKYETQHQERSSVLARKLAAQEEELSLVEREVGEMTSLMKSAVTGGGGTFSRTSENAASARAEADAVLDNGSNVAEEIDALKRSSARAERDGQADAMLAELKRRMGK